MTSPASSLSNPFDVTGKRVLVTGASRGIGRAIAVGFVHAGADVVGAARSEEGLKETATLASDGPGSFTAYAVDLLSPDSIEECITGTVAALGGLDVVVNNAADDHDSSIEETDLSVYQRVVDLNLQSCWLMIKSAAPHLKDGGGKVINIASILGLVAMRDDSAYVAAKHGLVGLTKAIGLEWARAGVQVNAIAPGYVETAMLPDLDANEAVAKFIRRQVPMGRWAQPEEFVASALFLASPASDYMTGQVMVVDGGLTAQ